MIDEQYQYIYVENPKTASSAIKHALMGAENVYNSYDPRVGTISHEIPRELKLKYPRQWQNYKKFVVVRNTWDRAASLFAFCTRDDYCPSLNGVSFEDWVMAGCPAPVEEMVRGMLRAFDNEPSPLCQLKFVEEVDEIIVLHEFDGAKRNQELLTGLDKVAEKFGFPLLDLPVAHNHSGRESAPLPWTKTMVDKVQSLYSEEIERFGFKAPVIF